MKFSKKNLVLFVICLSLAIPLKPAAYYSTKNDNIPVYIGIATTAVVAYSIGSISSYLSRYYVSNNYKNDFSLLNEHEGYETHEKAKDSLKKKLNEKINMDHVNYHSLSPNHQNRPLLHYEESVSNHIFRLWFLKLFNLHSEDTRKESNYLISQLMKLRNIVISMDRYWQERQSLRLRR